MLGIGEDCRVWVATAVESRLHLGEIFIEERFNFFRLYWLTR